MERVATQGFPSTYSHPRLEQLPPVARRFLQYVQIDTQSDPASNTVPSTEKQKILSRILVEELHAMGLTNAEMDEHGYVYATLASPTRSSTRLGLLAHVDTSSDEQGDARPLVHFDYDGSALVLPGDPDIILDPSTFPELRRHLGEHIITSDGTTLLGSDDKAGVAVLMQLAEDLIRDDSPRPELRICFTVDEEIGRGIDHLDLERFGADVAYTVDGGGINVIFAETFNAAEAVVDISGVMVHPGYAYGMMVNAVRIAGEFLAALPASEAPETTTGRDGYIHPHDIEESDAARARVTLILRDFSDEGLERRKDYVRTLVEWLRVRHPGASIALNIRDQYRNMRTYIEQSDPRVVRFALEAGREMGLEIEERLVRGGTDGSRLSELGIPTPNIFNGGYNFHSRYEWNTVQNLEHSLEYAKALVRYWGEHGSENDSHSTS